MRASVCVCVCVLCVLRYMKYLYPFECERKGLSSPSELQAAIDSNRREGRRPSYSSSMFRFSPSPSAAPHILSPPKMHLGALAAGSVGALNGLHASSGPSLKKGVGEWKRLGRPIREGGNTGAWSLWANEEGDGREAVVSCGKKYSLRSARWIETRRAVEMSVRV